jgi:hypothetical protein
MEPFFQILLRLISSGKVFFSLSAMILTTAVQVAASVVVLTLAGGCTRNMLQTAKVAKLPSPPSPSFPEEACASTDAMVNHLQTLNREELVRIFCSCPPPSDLSKLSGEWNGILLNNNNLGMTSIGSQFMSNVLFGKGRRWNGKFFGSGGKGINRFCGKQNGLIDKEHSFDFSIQESKIKRGTSSACLNYSNYQFPLSFWRTMTDEVRCLPGDILIGFGAMAWSGGMLNAAPFCLYPADGAQSRSILRAAEKVYRP